MNENRIPIKWPAVLTLILILFPGWFNPESTPAHAAHSPKVVFLSPSIETSQFFGPLTQFMKVAAQDLGIELELVYSQRSHVKMIQKGRTILEREVLPDYMICVNEKNVIPEILDLADQKGVNTILFNEGLILDDLKKFSSGLWEIDTFIGQVLPDDYQSGKLLAQTLIQQARDKNLYDDDGKIQLIGINGTRNTASPILRGRGLRDTIDQHDDVILHQVVHAYWEQQKAKTITDNLLRRYPGVKVVWAASDLMALGVSEAIESHGKKAGTHIITGGIDWAPFVFDSIEQGVLSASVGGHIFDGAWVMVMIYDHFHKVFKQFQSENTSFFVVTSENVGKYRTIMDAKNWHKIDFKAFSKYEHPQISAYNFGVGLILKNWRR
jgi:ABC-type sugar transport system substrate-binding protein